MADPQTIDITSSAAAKLLTPKDSDQKLQGKGGVLERLNALGITISDTETTGLSRGKNGLTEFASIRSASKSKDKYSLQMLHRFILPLRPEYQEYTQQLKDYQTKTLPAYEKECDEARAAQHTLPPKPSAPIYDREKYEYEVNPQALEVTGTELIRESPIDPKHNLDGPIVGIRVQGKAYYGKDYYLNHKMNLPKAPEDVAYPFYEVWPEIAEFTKSGDKDVYYNTPYDKPFLSELILDIEAYNFAKQFPAATISMSNIRFRPALEYLRKVHPELVTKDYESATPHERELIIETIRAGLQPEAQYINSTAYQCLLFNFMRAHGITESNTLDSAYKWVDGNFTGRDKHSADEDISMAAAVANKLAAKSKGETPTIPTMLDLFAQLVHEADPDASVTMKAEPRQKPESGKKPKELVWGDIEVVFSHPVSQLEADHSPYPAAASLWKFLHAFDVAPKLGRAPQHILELSKTAGSIGEKTSLPRVVINAERKQPLSLNLLKKWMLFSQIQRDAGKEISSPASTGKAKRERIIGFAPFDSTGTRVDVWVKTIGKNGALSEGKHHTIENCHYGSLRANLAFFKQHPDMVESGLELIKNLRTHDPRIGIVMIRERDDAKGYKLIIKGHSRQFGDVTINLPQNKELNDIQHSLNSRIDKLLKLGVIPFADSLHYAQEREQDDHNYEQVLDSGQDGQDDARRQESKPIVFHSEVNLDDAEKGNRSISIVLDQPIMQMMCLQLGHKLDDKPTDFPLKTKEGRTIQVHCSSDKQYTLSGELDAFWDFVYPGESMEEGKQLAEKPANVMRNASWLLHRLRSVAGTYNVEVHNDNMVHLIQKDGVSLEALNILYRAGVQFKAYKDVIKIDGEQLMHDAFHWSLKISRLQEDRKKDLEKPSDKQEMAPPMFLRNVQHALLRQDVLAMEVDELHQCWALDGSKVTTPTSAAHERDTHYLLDDTIQSKQEFNHTSGTTIDPCYSPIKGHQHLTMTRTDDGAMMGMSRLVFEACQAWRQKRGLECFPESGSGNYVNVRLSGKHLQRDIDEIEYVARKIYDLQKLTAIERLPIDDIQLDLDKSVSGRLDRKIHITLPPLRIFEDKAMLPKLVGFYQHLTDSNGSKALNRVMELLPKPQQVDPRRGDLMTLCDRTLEAFGEVENAAENMKALLFQTGGGQFSDRVHGLSFDDHAYNDLGLLGLFIHELSSDIKNPAVNADQIALLQQTRTNVNQVREKLFRFATASQRMDESALVLTKALVGKDGRQSASLKSALEDAVLYLIDTYALQEGNLQSVAALESSMKSYEALIERLSGNEADGKSKTKDKIASAYLKSLHHVLSLLNDPEQNTAALEVVARYLLKKQVPKPKQPLSEDEQAQLIDTTIAIFKADSTSFAQQKEGFLATFAESDNKVQDFIKARINERTILEESNQTIQHDLRTIPDDVSAAIEEDIRKAFKRRAGYYLNLIGNLEDGQTPIEPSQRRLYEGQARKCLKKAGFEEDEIEAKVARAKNKSVSGRVQLHSHEMVSEPVPNVKSATADIVLSVIEFDGCEDAARTALQERWRRNETQGRLKAQKIHGDPFEEFKVRKQMLRQLEKALKETNDMQLVLYHATRDLAATITQLQQDDQLRQQLPDAMAQHTSDIGQLIESTPRAMGLNSEAVSNVRKYRDQMFSGMKDRVSAALQLSPAQLAADHIISCKMSDVVAFLDQSKDKPVAKERTRPSLTRKEITNSRIFSAHMIRCVSESDIEYAQRSRLLSRKDAQMPQEELTLSMSKNPTRSEGMMQSLFRQFKATGLAELSENSADRTLKLTVGSDTLSVVVSLISLVDQLSQIPSITEVKLKEDRSLECTANISDKWKQRDVFKGELDLALFGIPAERPSWPAILGDEDEHKSTFRIELLDHVFEGKHQATALDLKTNKDILRATLRAQGMPEKSRRQAVSDVQSADAIPNDVISAATADRHWLARERMSLDL